MNEVKGINFGIGKKCIVRTYSAGVWFGTISEKNGNEVIVTDAIRLWKWKTQQGISLSSITVHGVDADGCKFAPSVNSVWIEAIEIIPCSQAAVNSIESVEAHEST